MLQPLLAARDTCALCLLGDQTGAKWKPAKSMQLVERGDRNRPASRGGRSRDRREKRRPPSVSPIGRRDGALLDWTAKVKGEWNEFAKEAVFSSTA
ncbi:hypothetical protein [Streptomyces aquilus]|uniref:hypothetical protein n=1 Tax=Streptomyces aquilus TaxID=2548456 RepID=UPI0036CA42D5